MLRVTKGMLASIVAVVAGLSMLLIGSVSAGQHSTGATVTVQAGVLAIDLSDDSAASFGTTPVNGTKNTTTNDGSDDDITIKNPASSIDYGSVGIKATDPGEGECDFTSGTDWELAESFLGSETDEFILKADVDDDNNMTDKVTLLAANTDIALIGSGFAADNAAHQLDLEITLSQNITTTGSPGCSISLTLTATAA
jgi:hypothetical protein